MTNSNKPIPTPMNDTQPTGLDLDEILQRYWVKAESLAGEMAKRSIEPEVTVSIYEKAFEEAKQALTRWGLEQRKDELENLKTYMTLYPVDPDWSHAVPERQIDIAIAELQANLQDGGEDGQI